VAALLRNSLTEPGVGRVMLWHGAMTELYLVMTQLFKPFVLSSIILFPFEFKTLEGSNMFRCHGTWLSFLIQPIIAALLRNPFPELGVGRILDWHDAAIKLHR